MSKKPVFQRAKDFMSLPDEKHIRYNAAASTDTIRLKDITLFSPGNKPLFHIDDFTAKSPGLILIKGENGSGKSTLFNIFSGIFSHEQLKTGKDGIYQIPEGFQENLGYLYYPDFIFPGTVEDNITYGRDIAKKDFDTVHACLNIPDANKIVRTKPENLSLGERQKIYLARLLLGNFECLLLDEPNSNLDVATEVNLLELIRQEKKKRLILIISHDNLFDSAADKIYFIKDGIMSEFKG